MSLQIRPMDAVFKTKLGTKVIQKITFCRSGGRSLPFVEMGFAHFVRRPHRRVLNWAEKIKNFLWRARLLWDGNGLGLCRIAKMQMISKYFIFL